MDFCCRELFMNESQLKRQVLKYLKTSFPSCWVYAPSDRFYSGVPDILMLWAGILYAFELKTNRGKVTKLQEHVLKQIEISGGKSKVFRSIMEVMNYFLDFTDCHIPRKKVPNNLNIFHVNPQCMDSRFCLPHGEHSGPVTYDMEKIFNRIKI